MKNIVVDYESFYDTKKGISVSTQAGPNYYASTDAYILSIVCEEFQWCGTIDQCREAFQPPFWTDPGHQFWGANANFDYGWHRKYFTDTAEPWKCILDVGVHHQLPRHLVGLAKTVLGVKMDKSTRDEMNGVDYFQLSDERQQQVNDYCLNDSIQEFAVLNKMAPMSAAEDRAAAHTRLINRRGVHVDVARVELDKERLSELKHKAFLEIPWHDEELPLSPEAFATWCASKGVPCPTSVDKRDANCTALMQQHPELKKVIESMRLYRGVNTLAAKAASLMARLHDGVLPLELLYAGAPHTKRWSSKGFNIQNLPKVPTVISGPWDADRIAKATKTGEKMPDDVHYVWLRNWFIPPPGYTFLILDYAQIEPRCLNWLAGNDAMMEALQSGYSYYEAYARAAKGWKGTAGTLKKEFGVARYTKLKNECLGCGYGMGPGKYQTYANVTEAEAKEIVTGFRKTNPKVVQFWRALDNLIISAGRSRDNNLEMQMPSGDILIHWDVKPKSTGGYRSITTKGDYSQQSIQNRLWGGTLCENVTQRMARDVLANAIVNLEDAGIPVIFHAHDEVILAVKDDASKEEARREAEHIMATPPDWAPGLPLATEGEFSPCYTK